MTQFLRVLLVVESSGGGVGRHVWDLAHELADRGHDVHLVFSPLRMDSMFRQEVAEVGTLEGRVRVSRCLIAHRPAVSDINAVLTLRRYAQRHGPFGVIHSHSTKAGFISRLGLRGCAPVLVHTPHGPLSMNPKFSGIQRRLVNSHERILAALCDGVITVSHNEYVHFLELGARRSKLFVVPNGVRPPMVAIPEARHRIRTKMSLGPEDLCVGFVGRLVPEKRLNALLKIFARATANLRAKGNVYLAVVGYGPCGPQLQRHAKELQIADRVLWLGEMDGKAVMPAFDILAAPSAYEAFGYVLLEAMAFGIPAVSTAVGIAPSLLRDGHNGYVVPSTRDDLLESRLRALLADRDMRTRMGRAAMESARGLTVENMVDKTLEVYRTLAPGAESGRVRSPHLADHLEGTSEHSGS